MEHKKVALGIGILVGIGGLVFLRWPASQQPPDKAMSSPLPPPLVTSTRVDTKTNARLAVPGVPRIKQKGADFSNAERAQFLAKFETKLKPALLKWCKAYGDRVPFNPNDVTPERFVERVGRDASYGEYIFVVDGITLGIREAKGVARVDYLNAARQTRKLTALPIGQEPPILSPPLTRDQVARLLEADGGERFPPNEIRMIPSGLSGSLNGGVFVNAGGDPERGGTWAYDMIFDPDGKLAYYLKGVER